MGIQWVPYLVSQPASLPKPLSLQNYGGPGTYNSAVQRSYLITFEVPTDSESMFWYTGRMIRDGTLVRMKLHAHNTLFQESMFFAATPEELGLYEQHGFSRIPPSQAILPGEVGFENNERLKEYIFSSLERSQQGEGDRQGEGGREEQGKVPRLICHSIGGIEVINGFAYDRRSPTSCDEWTWKEGEIFTVIGFNKWRGYPLGPHKPSLDPSQFPAHLAGHVGYWLSYDALQTPATSYWGYSLHNRYPDGGINDVLQIEGYQKVASGINGYTSPHFHDWSKTPHAVIAYIIFKGLQHVLLTLLFLSLLLCFGLSMIYNFWKKMTKETMRHKKDDEMMLCGDGGGGLKNTFFAWTILKDLLMTAGAVKATTTHLTREGGGVELNDQDQENEEKRSLLTEEGEG
jgi:hypothetical protein